MKPAIPENSVKGEKDCRGFNKFLAVMCQIIIIYIIKYTAFNYSSGRSEDKENSVADLIPVFLSRFVSSRLPDGAWIVGSKVNQKSTLFFSIFFVCGLFYFLLFFALYDTGLPFFKCLA